VAATVINGFSVVAEREERDGVVPFSVRDYHNSADSFDAADHSQELSSSPIGHSFQLGGFDLDIEGQSQFKDRDAAH
jgi:hypothetical protein